MGLKKETACAVRYQRGLQGGVALEMGLVEWTGFPLEEGQRREPTGGQGGLWGA